MKGLTIEDVHVYGTGLLRWFEADEFDLEDFKEGRKVHTLVTFLLENPIGKRFNSDLNGMSYEALCEYINKSTGNALERWEKSIAEELKNKDGE